MKIVSTRGQMGLARVLASDWKQGIPPNISIV